MYTVYAGMKLLVYLRNKLLNARLYMHDSVFNTCTDIEKHLNNIQYMYIEYTATEIMSHNMGKTENYKKPTANS